jgi:hypothetical protein
LPIDYSDEQELVVDGSPLYPLDHPALRRLPPGERDQLRRSLRLEFAFSHPGGTRVEHGSVILAPPPAGDDRPLILLCSVGRSAGDRSPADRTLGGLIIGGRSAGDAHRPAVSVTVNGRLLLGPSPEKLIPFATPPHRFGRSEPLVVTGQPGAGDFIYITYVDATHVRFGVDHWGRFARQSETQAIDYAIPHLITVSFGPLLTPGRATASVLEVELDNRVVFRVEPFTAYPTRRDAIAVGRNPIGGSTCEPVFTGVTLMAFRSPLDPLSR